MADNRKEVELHVGVTTGGTAELEGLGAELNNLAQHGGDAAPEFERLAAELERAEAATRDFRAAEAAARAEVQTQRRALDDARDGLARLRAESTAATRATEEYQAAERAARLAVIEAGAALRTKRDALNDASASAKTAAAAERTITTEAERTVAAYKRQGQAASDAAGQQTTEHRRVIEGLQGIGDKLQKLQALTGAAIGGQLLGGLIGDVARTADAFANLRARIGLVTGEGAALESAFGGVFEVATRTNTAVEETGNLFARIAQAGKAVGLSTADALRLTETVNQAVQVSGASAESSSAAVTQLVQALQSGVLRGDEFNSVMEQAPRLAQALADGLGVTTGELRKMAEAGALTSQTVIQALQGQAATLQSEFDKLPPTVGRALTGLSNAWTQYVGEVDKANGVSAAAASAINALARNLDTLGTLLYSAGKAAAAYQALKLAKTFLDVGTAAKTATAEIAAMTAAQTTNAAASAGAAANVGRFAALVSTLKAGALLGIVTNFREIGTWIGESIAKLQGYGKALEEAEIRQRADAETARQAAAEKAKLAQQAQLAADRLLGLNDVSRKLVAEFGEMTAKGERTSDALAKVAKGLDLRDLTGITNASAALDALAARGKITGDQVREALAGALKGIDLGLFETQARAAFDGSEQGARRLAAAIDAIALEALHRAGTSVEELRTGFSAAATSAINDVDALAKMVGALGIKSAETGRALATALEHATDAASSDRAIQAVIARWQELGRQGAITGDQLAAGLERARAKLDSLVPGITSVDEAFRTLGLRGPQELNRIADASRAAWERIKNDGTVALGQKLEAFKRYADAATQANGGVETSEITLQRRMLETEARARGLGDAIEGAMRRGTAATNDQTRAVEGLSQSWERAAIAADAAARQQAALNGTRTAGGVDGAKVHLSDTPQQGEIVGSYELSALSQLKEKQKLGTLSSNDLQLAQAAYQSANFDAETMKQVLQMNAGAYSLDGQRSIERALRESQDLLEAVKRLQSGNNGGGATHTVNINLGGRTRSVNTDAAGAQALESMLRELEQSAGRG